MAKARVTPMAAAPRRCPICGKPPAPSHAPFCSPRCADIDLGRWLKGTYSVASDDPPEEINPEDEPQ